MRSRSDEIDAFTELGRRAKLYRAPDAVTDLRQHGRHRAAEAVQSVPSWGATDQGPLVCVLYRGSFDLLPGNKLGDCVDCGERLFYRPQVAENWVKLCVFCALKRTSN